MSWARNYWDVFHHLYWSPEFLGLDPVKTFPDPAGDSLVKVEKSYLSRGRRLRYRSKTWPEVRAKLNGDEKALNSFFDIMFSICPDSIISEWFGLPLSINDTSSFESLSLLSICDRYNWGNDNITQPDGLFISAKSIICVEIKLEARTSISQMLKYACIIMLEEIHSGNRESIGLLYIVPKSRSESTNAQLQRWGSLLQRWGALPDWDILEAHPETHDLNRFATKIIEANRAHFLSVISRLRLGVVSWSDLYARASAERDRLDPKSSEQQTLYRLLDGFMEQLREHQKTGIVQV